MGGEPLQPWRLPDEVTPMQARLDTRYITAGMNYNLSIWRRLLIIVQLVDKRGKFRMLWYHDEEAFRKEWEECDAEDE